MRYVFSPPLFPWSCRSRESTVIVREILIDIGTEIVTEFFGYKCEYTLFQIENYFRASKLETASIE